MANQLLFGNVFALRKQRVYRDRIELATLSDRQIRSRFRFKRESIQFISDLLRNDLSHTTRRSQPISVEMQVMLALRFYASGSFLEVIGDTMGVDKATACRAVNDVTNALLSKKDQFIKWPARQEERDRNKQGFFRGGLFPGVIGCIDGTHVKIQAPSEDEPAYVNRKGWHSINVQGICDHEGKFINVDAQWPGSTHDSHMFRASDVSTYLQIRHRSIDDGFLLGDSGYACSKFLLTPYLHPATPSQEAYNRAHTRTRCTIERVFGWWKRRFHVLHGEVRMKPAKVCRIIGACAILHNIAIMLREPMEDDESGENQEDVGQMNYNGPEDGRSIRNFITTSYF
ncbi:HARBI1 [Mytilus edulis]|uniref:Putative nuclease HARBI1 n=1 Tax=Mytilus edulis TaxID=6550 RepID=A0A8S3V5E7_MYTED|nr:HARBI1 [Mytilus edulis]